MKKASEFVEERLDYINSQLVTIEKMLSDMLDTDVAQTEFNLYKCITITKDCEEAILEMLRSIPGSAEDLRNLLRQYEWELETPEDTDGAFVLRPLAKS